MRFICTILIFFLILNVCSAQLFNGRYNPADGILYAHHFPPNPRPDADRGMLFRFENGGARLVVINHDIPGWVFSLDNQPGHLFSWLAYSAGMPEVYQSADSGETWTLMDSFPAYIFGYSREGEQPGQCFAKSRLLITNQIYSTNDGWSTFDSVETTLLGDSIMFVGFGSHNGLIYGMLPASGCICISSDTGRTWSIGSSNPILPRLEPDAVGAGDELWGKHGRVYALQDTGRTAIDSVINYHLSSTFDPWSSEVIATNQPGEVYLMASRGLDVHVEIVLYHAVNYGAQVDSFYYDVPIEYTSVNSVYQPLTFHFSAYPNPFNSSATISFSLARASEVKLAVYDVLGRMTGDHMGSPLRYAAGEHRVTFDGTGLSSGTYFLQMETAGMVQTRKIILLK